MLHNAYPDIVDNHVKRLSSGVRTSRDRAVREFCEQHTGELTHEEAADLSGILGENLIGLEYIRFKLSRECSKKRGRKRGKKWAKTATKTRFEQFEALVRLLGVSPCHILDKSDKIAAAYCDAQLQRNKEWPWSTSEPESPAKGFFLLPARLPFLCRDDEVQAATDLVGASKYRLIDISGPFGVGTSHLASEVLGRLHGKYGWQVAFVSLEGKTDPREVIAAVSAALKIERLGLDDRANARRDASLEINDAVEQRLNGLLQDAPPLALVLDDFRGNRKLAQATFLSWLAATENLKIVLTTRNRIDLGIQVRHEMHPMPYPKDRQWETEPVSNLERLPSFVLFAAMASKEGFHCGRLDDRGIRIVARILSMTDGLPGCICSVAAATRRWFTAKDLELRFPAPSSRNARGSAPDRSQWTIYEDIISTWDAAEVTALRCLAMFPASFLRSDAESVLGLPNAAFERAWDRIDGFYFFEQASDSSNGGDEAPWRVVSLVRDWLNNRPRPPADASFASEHRKRFCDHYVTRCETLGAALHGRDRARIMRELLAIWEHVIMAVAECRDGNDYATAARGLISLEEFLILRGLGDIYLTHADSLLTRGDGLDSCARAHLLNGCARAHFANGDFRKASERSLSSITEAEKCPDPIILAECLRRHTDIIPPKASNEFHRDQLKYLERAKAIYEAAKDPRSQLCGGAIHWDWLGQPERAKSAGEEALRYAVSVGDPFEIALRYRTLGQILWRDGQPDKGLECFDNALKALPPEIHSPNLIGSLKTNRGLALSDIEGQADAAKAAFAEGLKLLQQAQNETWQLTNLIGQARLLLRRAPAQAKAQAEVALDFIALHLSHSSFRSSDNEILLRVIKGVCLTRADRFAEGKELLLEANGMQRDRSSLNTLRCFCSTVALARCHLELGELAEAKAQVAAANEIATARKITDKYSVPYVRNTHTQLKQVEAQLASNSPVSPP
jgi:hypothetical protein